MLIVNVVLFLGLSLSIVLLLNWTLPNFKRQRQLAAQAALLTKTSTELRRLRLDPLTRYTADKWMPKLSPRLGLGGASKARKMYEFLGKEHSFEEELAGYLFKSALGTLPFLILPFILSPVFYLVLPVAFGGFFVWQIAEIKGRYKERQAEIIRDIPDLISKLQMAQETGRPFLQVISRLEETSGPRIRPLVKRLNANIQIMKEGEALDLFATETGIPVMREFAAAMKVSINNGYEEAKEHFETIRGDLEALRLVSLREITSNQPEKVNRLLFLIAIFAFIAVGLAFYQVMGSLGSIA